MFGSYNSSFCLSLGFVEAATLFLFPVFPGNGHSVVTLPHLEPVSLQVMEHLLMPQTLHC